MTYIKFRTGHEKEIKEGQVTYHYQDGSLQVDVGEARTWIVTKDMIIKPKKKYRSGD